MTRLMHNVQSQKCGKLRAITPNTVYTRSRQPRACPVRSNAHAHDFA